MYSDSEPFSSEAAGRPDHGSPNAQSPSPVENASQRQDRTQWYWSPEHRDYIQYRGLCSGATREASQQSARRLTSEFQATNSFFTESISGLVIPPIPNHLNRPSHPRLKTIIAAVHQLHGRAMESSQQARRHGKVGLTLELSDAT